ncbi:flocculation protein FLO11 isoform X3 [Trematomus bernacchii]|uniref:flocculation protein FLO11 isoform X3 n=1 Tax=Trematomus bernacchii TaxID=40690 RepID=UPI00146F4413|nr:flocculation protein FLO11 isoform X3 [Trematomus bernacchii]
MADSGPSWRKTSGDQSSKPGERAPSESGDQSSKPGERAPSEIEDQSSNPGEKAPSETEDQSSKPGERATSETEDQSSKPVERAPPETEDQSSKPGERAPSESGDQSTQHGERAPSETPSESTQPGERAPSETPSESTQPGERAPSETPSESTQPGEVSESGSESTQLMEVSESGSERTQPMDSLAAGSGAQLVDLLQSCPEQTLLLGSEFSGLGPDLANTTIIYVQADGSLVEGSGLTAEEQQALLEQLTQQQVVQVSDSEAAQLLHQSQLLRTTTTHNTALDPSQLQQVINQVTKSQQQVQVPQQNLKQVQVSQQNLKQVQVSQQNLKQVQVPQQNLKNASQQLKTAAQQVAMQTGGSVQVIQKKPEPVRIQIQVPSKQEVKSGPAPQQGIVAVNHPHVKLSANGSAQILHLQPVIGQQGQQFFLQQGDAPIQLLLHSPAPVPGSLLPLVHKLTGQTPSSSQKPPVRVQPPAVIRTEAKTASIPLIKTSTSPSTPVQGPVKLVQGPVKLVQGPVKPVQSPVKPVQSPVKLVQSPVKPVQSPRPPVRDKEQKKRKRESKAAKVQTRSGRVSRPPKYKAKDYKFIKTEDLADSHQSDSDDYSDLSEEEEGGPGLAPPLTCSHKSRPHSCQTCDKAYIGAGGLNRHYRLNPTHGEPDPPGDTPRPLSDDSQPEETTAGRREEEEEEEEEKPVAMTTSRVEGGPAAGLRGLPPRRGPGRPRGRGRGRGRGRVLGPPPKVVGGLVSRRGRRGRPPKLAVTMATAEQLAERRRERLQEVVQQCGDQELVEALLPRLSEKISLWELLLAKVDGGAATRFPDMYREFESLQAQVRQAAQDYIISPQAGGAPLEVRNIEVARSLGILDEVNRMKVLPGSSPSLTNKSVRYLENSKMLPPSKRFKMENRVQQNGVTGPVFGPSGSSPLKSVSDSASSSCPPAEARTLMKEEVLGPGSESAPPEEQIYLQTGGLTVQPGDRMVILNGPDGTTMQIQTPEGVPLEGVPLEGVPLEALLGIEAPQ